MQNASEKRKQRWSFILTRFMILALTIVFFFLLFRLDDLFSKIRHVLVILRPFIFGGVMAYLLRIPCNFFEKYLEKWLPQRLKKGTTGLAIFISMFLIALLVFIFIRMAAPQLIVSISSIVSLLPDAVTKASQWIQTKLADYPVIETYVLSAIDDIYPRFLQWTETDLLPLLQDMAGGFASTVTSVVSYLGNLLIGVVVCIYTLASRKQFARQSKAVVYSILKPKWAESVLDEINFADKMFVGFFGGRILDSAIIGVICYICCLILKFPNAMLISLIVGVTNVIPYFGPWIGAIPSVLLILIVSPIKCIWFIIFVIILQGFDGNVLGPRLLANSTGLSSFWVLFSITLFSGLFGFVGILVGVPVFAVIYDLIRKLVIYGLKRNGKLDILKGTASDEEEGQSIEEQDIEEQQNIREEQKKDENQNIGNEENTDDEPHADESRQGDKKRN